MGKSPFVSWLSSISTALGNFCVQYNFQSIAICLIIMSASECTSDDGNCRDGDQASWVEGTSSAIIFIGAVCGQLSMGFLGDYLTRNYALSVTLFLAALGAFLSAVASVGTATSVYSSIIAFRFILGIGLGGIYPLSATKASEDSSAKDGVVNSQGSSWSFFWQIPGLITPYIVAYILSYTNTSASFKWRIILGLGAVPAILAIIALVLENCYTFQPIDNSEGSKAALSLSPTSSDKKQTTLSDIMNSLKDTSIRNKLIACGGTWFLYDVVVYGLGLLAGEVLEAISSDDDNVSSNTNIQDITSKLMIAFALNAPATFFSILALPYMGLKWLQLWSFIFVALCFLFMAAMFDYLKQNSTSGLFGLYCVSLMSLQLGIGITTYSLPAALFPMEIRSTFNGISAAMGKVGAIFGAYTFYAIAQASSYSTVIGICCFVAIVGAIVTYFFIDEKELLNDERNSTVTTDMTRNTTNTNFNSPHTGQIPAGATIAMTGTTINTLHTQSSIRNTTINSYRDSTFSHVEI